MRERKSVCVNEREKEYVRERERKSVCVHMFKHKQGSSIELGSFQWIWAQKVINERENDRIKRQYSKQKNRTET